MRESPTPTRDGGIFTLAMLESLGIGESKRAALLRTGALVRLRYGWFARPDADIDRARAVRIGGRITCVTALKQQGLWVMPDRRLHVAVRENASRLRCPDDRRKRWDPQSHPTISLHWAEHAWDGPAAPAVENLGTSIAHLLRCLDRNSAIVTIDSALNTTVGDRRLLTMSELGLVINQLPASYQRILDLVDPRAQSGLETLARLKLRGRGIRVRTQAKIERVGRVDVLIGDRLVLELDGRTHHLGDNYELDRARDLELFRQGFTVLRVSYRQVMYEWESVEAIILQAVRRGDHLRRGIHNRLGLANAR
jgi:very-short-patch-repair endonuclease